MKKYRQGKIIIMNAAAGDDIKKGVLKDIETGENIPFIAPPDVKLHDIVEYEPGRKLPYKSLKNKTFGAAKVRR